MDPYTGRTYALGEDLAAPVPVGSDIDFAEFEARADAMLEEQRRALSVDEMRALVDRPQALVRVEPEVAQLARLGERERDRRKRRRQQSRASRKRNR